MNRDQEQWAATPAIEKRYGPDAPAYIAERIEALARAGDEADVRRFRKIAALLDQLTHGDTQ